MLNLRAALKKYILNFLLFVFSIPVFSFPSTVISVLGIKFQNILLEGFAIDTLINTPHGMLRIQDIQQNDIIWGIDGQLSIITHISRQKVDQYVEIKTDDVILRIGLHQKFYLKCRRWVPACDIKVGDEIFNISGKRSIIREIQCVQEEIFLYQLTTYNHLLIISQSQLLAHNADLALSPIVIGGITSFNPIITTIGVTLALSIGALLVYQKIYQKLKVDANTIIEIDLSECESIYYEERKKELINLKKDLVEIHNGLSLLYPSSKKSFSNIFLQSITHDIQAKKSFLNRQQREAHLCSLEEEIIELHTRICFHFAELIKRVEHAFDKYCAFCSKKNIYITDWNLNLKNIPINIAYSLFEKIVQVLELISRIENRLAELEVAGTYYKKLRDDSILKKSTSIDRTLVNIGKIIDQSKQYITKNKSQQLYNKKNVSNFLQAKHAPVEGIENNVLKSWKIQIEQDESQELEWAHASYKQIPRHSVMISQTSMDLPCPCNCGCKNFECGCTCGCPCKKNARLIRLQNKNFLTIRLLKQIMSTIEMEFIC